MKKYVIILSKTNPFAYENRRMRRALEALGIETVCCDPGQFAVTTGLKPGLTYKGLPFHTPDLVIVRTGSGTGTHTVTVLRAMVGMGIIVINPISAIQTAMDKVATAQLASDAGLLTPKTLIVTGQSDVVSAWTGGYPCIVKLASGSGGRGVLKCESPAQLKSVIQLIFKLDPNRLFLIQEYLGDRPGGPPRLGDWIPGSLRHAPASFQRRLSCRDIRRRNGPAVRDD
jgi:gamma-F420-2:alpha-L-glutamate ligase